MCFVNGFQMSHCMARMPNHKIKNYCFTEYYLNPSKYFCHPEIGEQNGPLNMRSLSDIAWFKLKVRFERQQILCIGFFREYKHSF